MTTTKWDSFADIYRDYIMNESFWDFADYIKNLNDSENLFANDELDKFIEWCDVTPKLYVEEAN